MTEAEDYEIQQNGKYYKIDHAFEFQHYLNKIIGKKALYVGCGRGEFLRQDPVNWLGVDFNKNLMPLWNKLKLAAENADARSMPQFRNNQFEYTFSTDFFEHIKPHEIKQIYLELSRIAIHGVHVIDTTAQSGFRGVDKKNLHPSGGVSIAEWMEHFNNLPRVQSLGRHLIFEW